MGQVSLVFDSTLLIDCLNDVPDATAELKRHPDAAISIISWIEVMAGAHTERESDRLKAFLSRFPCIQLNSEIAERAAILRQKRKLKLPDAVILATAQVHHATLVTRNTRDFSEKLPGVRVPYRM